MHHHLEHNLIQAIARVNRLHEPYRDWETDRKSVV